MGHRTPHNIPALNSLMIEHTLHNDDIIKYTMLRVVFKAGAREDLGAVD